MVISPDTTCGVWLVRGGGDNGELRPWHYIYEDMRGDETHTVREEHAFTLAFSHLMLSRHESAVPHTLTGGVYGGWGQNPPAKWDGGALS